MRRREAAARAVVMRGRRATHIHFNPAHIHFADVPVAERLVEGGRAIKHVLRARRAWLVRRKTRRGRGACGGARPPRGPW